MRLPDRRSDGGDVLWFNNAAEVFAHVLGNGKITGICDVIVVDFHRFERHNSVTTAQTVGRMNAALRKEDRPYLLVGVGRWGSTDPYLGIPVGWNQISGARVVPPTSPAASVPSALR